MRRLWQPVEADHPFHTVAAWGERGIYGIRRRFNGATGPFPVKLVELAEACFAAAKTADDQVLLHGDLHHENVLAAQREPWLVIDPKGIVGPRGYECGTYLRNYLFDQADPARANARRARQLAEILGLELEAVLRWSVAHNVLSAWWSYDNGPDIRHGDALACAMLCAQQL
jgi:streptomycin 6-kinase